MILWYGLKTGVPDKHLACILASLREPASKVGGGLTRLCTTLWDPEEQEQSGKAAWIGS